MVASGDLAVAVMQSLWWAVGVSGMEMGVSLKQCLQKGDVIECA